MLSRWWVPLHGINPEGVALQHLHAVVSGWFDSTEVEHRAHDKPYAMSPLSSGAAGGSVGVEVGALTEWAGERVLTAQGNAVRLGRQAGTVGQPVLIAHASWAQLAAPTTHRAWRLELQSPTTFRTQGRSTPLPSADTILLTLARLWSTWSDVPLPAENAVRGALWVSELDLSSQTLTMPQRDSSGGQRHLTFSGSVGSMVMRSAHAAGAQVGAPLLALANFSGVGSMTRKGFGVAHSQPLVRAHEEERPRRRLRGSAKPQRLRA